jgi:hypothetical protein
LSEKLPRPFFQIGFLIGNDLVFTLAPKIRWSEAMVDLCVIDLFGPICVDSEDGTRLCDRAREALGRGETVCLDFTGVTTLASAFLNTAVGCLYAFFDKEDLDRRLLWRGLDATDEAVLRIVQRNAVRFYSAPKSLQQALLSSSFPAAGE